MNLLQNTTRLALAICEKYVDKTDEVVDCTCGRGNDTLFFARICKRVYSFDIQEEALASAKKLMSENNISWSEYPLGEDVCEEEVYEKDKVIFIKDNHANMRLYVKKAPAVIIFNLGYLPGGDKKVTTLPENSLKAVDAALELVREGGLVCITMYPGHEKGREERNLLRNYAGKLEKDRFHCVCTDMLNQGSSAPEILWITKKK